MSTLPLSNLGNSGTGSAELAARVSSEPALQPKPSIPSLLSIVDASLKEAEASVPHFKVSNDRAYFTRLCGEIRAHAQRIDAAFEYLATSGLAPLETSSTIAFLRQVKGAPTRTEVHETCICVHELGDDLGVRWIRNLASPKEDRCVLYDLAAARAAMQLRDTYEAICSAVQQRLLSQPSVESGYLPDIHITNLRSDTPFIAAEILGALPNELREPVRTLIRNTSTRAAENALREITEHELLSSSSVRKALVYAVLCGSAPAFEALCLAHAGEPKSIYEFAERILQSPHIDLGVKTRAARCAAETAPGLEEGDARNLLSAPDRFEIAKRWLSSPRLAELPAPLRTLLLRDFVEIGKSCDLGIVLSATERCPDLLACAAPSIREWEALQKAAQRRARLDAIMTPFRQAWSKLAHLIPEDLHPL